MGAGKIINRFIMLTTRDRERLIDELIEERPEANIKDYLLAVVEIENELNLIEDSFKNVQ